MPNPATDFLNIVLRGNPEGDVVFEIFDGSAKLIYQNKFYGNFKRFTAHIERLAPGIYYAKLMTGDHIFTEKFVKL